MNEILYEKLICLKNEINNSEEMKKLVYLNSLIENDEEVMRLCYKKDCAVTEFEDALKHFGENSDVTLKAQKSLHEAKLALDTNELVNEYNKQFKIVRDMYDLINNRLFEQFK